MSMIIINLQMYNYYVFEKKKKEEQQKKQKENREHKVKEERKSIITKIYFRDVTDSVRKVRKQSEKLRY